MHINFPQRYLRRRRAPILALLTVVGIIAAPLLLRVIPLLFDQMLLLEKLQQGGGWAILIFLLLHVFATVVGIPGIVLTVVGGLAFGLVWGSLWSLIGATLGALGAFWLARYFLRGWVKRRVNDQELVAIFNRAIQKRPLAFVLMVRFVPISPFNLVNFLFGLTRIHWLPYGLGTLLGIIPGVIAYTWLGVSGQQAMQQHSFGPLVWACSVLALLSALPLLWRRRRRQH